MNTRKITTMGILIGMAMVLNLLIRFPMVPAVSFLQYDPKDIIIIIGGFIYGPISALLMSIIASILEIFLRGGNIIDVTMNVISTCGIACTASYFYQKKHTKKSAIIGLIIGILVSTILMSIWNLLVTPIYYSMPREWVLSLMLPGIIPFNLIKNSLNAIITILLYKPIVSTLRRSHLLENSNKKNIISVGTIVISVFILITIIVTVLMINGVI